MTRTRTLGIPKTIQQVYIMAGRTAGMSDMERQLKARLDEWGEVHAWTDGGQELHLHKHDVEFDSGLIVLDSKDRYAEIDVGKIEIIERPESH